MQNCLQQVFTLLENFVRISKCELAFQTLKHIYKTINVTLPELLYLAQQEKILIGCQTSRLPLAQFAVPNEW